MNSYMPSRIIVAAVSTLLVATVTSFGDTQTNQTGAPPALHVAGRGTIKVKAQLDAVAEAVEAEPVKLAPKAWMDLTVIEAVQHGSRVKKGDILVKLDLEKLRDQLEDMEADRPLSSLTMDLAQAELENLKQSTPQKLEAARRTHRIANEEFDYFDSTGRSNREKMAKFGLKSSEQRLENAAEEMKQLEKMYKADDLTEETEEIVLKRQRFQVEAAQLFLQNSREGTERDLKVLIPREEEGLKNARREQELALTYSEQTLPKNLSKKQLDLEKLKRDQRKAERKLNDFRYDIDILTPRSPVDGIVYYGACENGKWTTGPIVSKKLVAGGKLMPNEILMTVVNPEKVRLRAVIPEADLGNFKSGLEGEATPTFATDRKLAVKLDDIGMVPLPGGGFDTTLSLTLDKEVRLLPGMNCKVSFGNVQKNVGIAVPKQAVFTEGTQKVVYVQKTDGSSDKRNVKTGESDDNLTEITDGIAAGDKVLLTKPETKSEKTEKAETKPEGKTAA